MKRKKKITRTQLRRILEEEYRRNKVPPINVVNPRDIKILSKIVSESSNIDQNKNKKSLAKSEFKKLVENEIKEMILSEFDAKAISGILQGVGAVAKEKGIADVGKFLKTGAGKRAAEIAAHNLAGAAKTAGKKYLSSAEGQEQMLGLAGDMWSKHSQTKEREARQQGRAISSGLTDALTLYNSMKGLGTSDEAGITKIIKKRANDLSQLDREFKQVLGIKNYTGNAFDLDDWLKGDGMDEEAELVSTAIMSGDSQQSQSRMGMQSYGGAPDFGGGGMGFSQY